jgi:hypothetical protein
VVPFIVAGELVVDVAAFACFCLCFAFLFAYRSTLGALLTSLAQAFDSVNLNLGVVNVGLGFLGSAVDTLNNAILRGLGLAVESTEYSWHQWWNWTARAFYAIGDAERYVAQETLQGFKILRRAVIPTLIAAAVGPLLTAISDLRDLTKGVAKTITIRVTKVEALSHAQLLKIERAVAGTIAYPIPKLGHIETDLSEAWAKLRGIGKTLTPAGILGLVLAALSAVGLGSARCANTQRWNKAMCGLPTQVLENLLGGLVAIFGTLSLVKLAEDYQKVFPDVASSVTHFWRADLAHTPGNPGLGETGL